jgi:hypothetical protein
MAWSPKDTANRFMGTTMRQIFPSDWHQDESQVYSLRRLQLLRLSSMVSSGG